MAKDTRLYAKISLDIVDHPKIQPLSDAAFRCLIEATVWSRAHLTDGFLARRLALARWSLQTLQELCANDDEKPTLNECDDGWYIRDFDEHQDTKADVEARRERNRIAGQIGGLASGKQRAKQHAKQHAKRSAERIVNDFQPETDSSYRAISARATPLNSAAPAAQTRPETLEEALARAERENQEIF